MEEKNQGGYKINLLFSLRVILLTRYIRNGGREEIRFFILMPFMNFFILNHMTALPTQIIKQI